jgi:hypothetical protein
LYSKDKDRNTHLNLTIPRHVLVAGESSKQVALQLLHYDLCIVLMVGKAGLISVPDGSKKLALRTTGRH